MLTYQLIIKVKLDNKLIGEIRVVKNGFQYFPKGSKDGGDIFPSIDACKASL